MKRSGRGPSKPSRKLRQTFGRARWRGASLAVLLAAIVSSASCGTSDGGDANSYGGGAGPAGGDAGAPDSGGSGGALEEAGLLDTSLGDAPADASCVYLVDEGIRTPLNLYIMFDKSSSMVGTKWDSAKLGLAAFLNDPKSATVRVALNFFPRPPDSTPVCDQMAYKEPRVPFGELPQNAGALIDALDAESPDGFGTPTYPALGGAILAAIDVTATGESAAVLLVTDGEPQGPATSCGGVNPEDPVEIAKLAANGAAYHPPVTTYVIGLPGASQAVANQIAAAGGSGAAILVAASNVQQAFQDALAKVRGQALPCEFEIPTEVEQGEVEPGNVNVLYTSPASTEPDTIPKSLDACASGGWVYDDDAAPTRITLCPGTCEQIRDDLDGTIEIMLGCKTVVK